MSITTDAISRRAVLQGSDKTKAFKKVTGTAKAPPANRPQPRDTMSESAKNIVNRVAVQKDPEVDVRRRSLSQVLGMK